MKNKLCALLLAGLLLALTGCQLAKPEKENELLGGDRFAGVYAVYDDGSGWEEREMPTGDGGTELIQVNTNSFWSSDNPLLTEMGEETIGTGKYGDISVPKLVLIGEYDEKQREYVFPGLEGFSLFVTHTIEADGAPLTACHSNMGDGRFDLTSTDAGEKTELEGTIYIGPPLGAGADWDEYEDHDSFWKFYRVYQAQDGTVYLDGSGNSYSGGGGFSTTQTATQKTTIGDEVTEESVSVTVNVDSVPRITRLTVTQFDESNLILQSQALPLSGELPEIDCLPTAAWVLVESESIEGVERTVYNVPQDGDDPLYHQVILLDDSGIGYTAQLLIK